MRILDELIGMREHFEVKDYKEALAALMQHVHYKVAPRVTSGSTFTLFRNETDMVEFCNNVQPYQPDIRGLRRVLDKMRKEGLIMQDAFPVTLTQLGVEKLCV